MPFGSVSVEDIRRIEENCVGLGISKLQLMENAGKAIADRVRHLSLIHISEPTRRTPLYSSAASDVYKRQVEDIRRIEENCVGLGISKLQLMENAGKAIADRVRHLFQGSRIP